MLYLRWIIRPRIDTKEVHCHFKGIERCQVVYINLDHRVDRRQQIEKEFLDLGLHEYKRFSAVYRTRGALGCAESHLRVLESWSIDSKDLLMICEDDCEFLLAREDVDNLIEEFALNANLSVLCLGYNARNGINISSRFKITSNTQTMSCYVIKPNARGSLIKAARRSVDSLLPGGQPLAIDIAWKTEQKSIFFAIPIFRAVRQRASFSDIEKRNVEYFV